MPTFKVAHIREQGVDLILVPVDRAFGNRPRSDQLAIVAELNALSHSARLAGTVVPVWDYARGQMAFIAPTRWHPFFQSINLSWVRSRLNRELHIFTFGTGGPAAIALDIAAEHV